MRTKTIALPRLNNLRPTLESTALKLMEEAGELSEAIGKLRALSGEREAADAETVALSIGRELLDVAQTAVTMMFVLEEQHGIDIDRVLREHVDKLIRKGYLVLETADGAAGGR
ncbi:MAG: MazG-like family protein [Clostridia bacterium]|nr:MazG-like family protein [Clostridia bacterium]